MRERTIRDDLGNGTMTGLTMVLVLVVLATAVATGARHWRMPAPSLLVLAGLVVGLLPWVPDTRVAPQVISVVVLPPLLYASAEEMSGRDLRAVWKPVTVLVFGLVLASAGAVGFVVSAVTPLPSSSAFVLGAVLASTDPVAVTALGRRLALPSRVQVMVQAESLFNDATSLVLFKVAVGTAVATSAVSAPQAMAQFALLGGGGALAGAAVAGLVTLIRRRTQEPVLETVIALVTPYAAYVVAEDLGASGVTAVVVAGIILGSGGHKLSNAPIRLHVHAVYSTVVFLLESVVFAIIGLQLPALVRQLAPNERAWPLWALGVAVTVLTVRILWIFPVSTLTQHRRGAERVSWRTPAVLSWAGTRGVMPLAAALSIPLTTHSGAALPYRPLILVLTTGVVVLSLVIQGLTLAPVVRRAGIALEPEHTAREEARARESLARAALTELGQLAELDVAPEVVVDQARRHFQARAEQTPVEATDSEAHKALRLALISAQSAELWRLYESNDVSDTTRRRLQRALDLEEAGLNDA